jgi:ATP-dependent exoDNAse (exonuclease V) beta subunit
LDNPSTFQVYNASAGSGKTFALVKEYLKIILKDPDTRLYQNILAITFTNKAASEMKDRILENLLRFAIMSEQDKQNDMLLILMKETKLDLRTIQKRAKERLQDILKNFASFHIKTIDSFTNKLIKSFAFDLGLTMDFEVELDTDSILKEAVDMVLSRIGVDKELTEVLVSFAKEKTLDDKSWDVSLDLFEVSKLLLNENHIHEIIKLSGKNLAEFKILANKLQADQKLKKKELAAIGGKAMNLIHDKGIEASDFQRSQFPKFFLKMIDTPEKLDFDKEGSLSRNIESRYFYAKGKPQQIKNVIDEIADSLIAFYFEASEVFERFKLNELVLKNLIPLAVVNSIHLALEEIKVNNNIRLNAEFNQIISDHLTNEPAAFIYEKLGEKFRHFFIDEMQDTSILQWKNIIPLIDNALSTEASSAMLVGDAKQAIYRWRGGRAEQFINLSSDNLDHDSNPFQIKKIARNLESNYRSHAEIISFNNQFFSYIANHFDKKLYADLYHKGNDQSANKKTGGYVQLRFLEELKNSEQKDEIYPKVVHETIQGLLNDFDPGEICILIRKKKEGVAIAKYLTEQGMPIVSSETLLIRNNQKVNFVINLLKLIQDNKNEDAKFEVLNFLYDHLKISSDKHNFFTDFIGLEPRDMCSKLENFGINYNIQRFNDYSIFEGVEDIIRSFRLTQFSDAYLQFFLDFVFDFTQRKSQKNSQFLEYWDEKKEKLNIVISDDVQAVRIMTIHKSKGLEFPVVIYPYDLDVYFERSPKAWYKELDKDDFNGFDSILIDSTSRIEKAGPHGKSILQEQREEKELDSFNLLYVCLTRAIEQLYVITESKKPGEKLNWSSHLMRDFLMGKEIWDDQQSIYEFGDKKRVSTKPSADNRAETQQEFISTSWKDHQINIVTNSSLLWGQKREAAIDYGNLIHEMMSVIYTIDDIEKTLERYVNKGLMPNDMKDSNRKVIQKIVEHPELKSYFDKNAVVITEREILTDTDQILIPDRLVFNGMEVVIIDYKTGKPSQNHQRQIDNYALVLQKMKYDVIHKILVYIDQDIKIIKS